MLIARTDSLTQTRLVSSGNWPLKHAGCCLLTVTGSATQLKPHLGFYKIKHSFDSYHVTLFRITKICCLQSLTSLNVLDLQDNQVPLSLCDCVCAHVPVCVWERGGGRDQSSLLVKSSQQVILIILLCWTLSSITSMLRLTVVGLLSKKKLLQLLTRTDMAARGQAWQATSYHIQVGRQFIAGLRDKLHSHPLTTESSVVHVMCLDY